MPKSRATITASQPTAGRTPGASGAAGRRDRGCLSVIVPATDAPQTLGRCVKAAQAAMAPGDELVVVDSPGGLGPAAARNEGARRARHELLAFVDADVQAAPDALIHMRDRLAEDQGLSAVFGSYDDAPAAGGLVSRFRNLLHHHVHQAASGPATTFWSGLGVVRRDAFEAVGGFDERRFPRASIEDVELGMRLTASGGRVLLEPRAQGKHLKRWSLADMVATDFGRRGVPWIQLQLRSRTGSTALNLGWRHRASAAACAIGVGAGVLRAPTTVVAAAALLLWLNRSFYALLARRTGLRGVVGGVVLHVVHLLTAVAAVPAGAAAHARERLGQPAPGPDPGRRATHAG